MPERKIAVVFLVTDKVDELVPFYRDIVGLKLTSHEPGHSAWFETGTVPLAIHRPEAERGDQHDLVPPTTTLIWFQPGEGVATSARTLEKAGMQLVRAKNAQNYFFLRDPEGRIIGFHEPA